MKHTARESVQRSVMFTSFWIRIKRIQNVTRAGLVIGHTGHFPGGPMHFRGRQNVFFAKDHHAGTASSQWPIGLSPVLTA